MNFLDTAIIPITTFQGINFCKITGCLQEKMFWEFNMYKLRVRWYYSEKLACGAGMGSVIFTEINCPKHFFRSVYFVWTMVRHFF